MSRRDIEALKGLLADVESTVDVGMVRGDETHPLHKSVIAAELRLSLDCPAGAELVEAARQKYACGSNNDIEIDDDSQASRADDGTWVQAWVWMPKDGGNGGDDKAE